MGGTQHRGAAKGAADPGDLPARGEPCLEVTPVLRSQEVARLIAAELPFLRRIARRWPAVGTDAEDLVQDTLMRALANLHRWEPGTNLRGWLFTIMRNQFFDGKNRLKRAEVAMRGYADLNLAPALDQQDARLILRDVKRAIPRLPNAQRVALLLVGVEGRAHEDVVKTLELSAAALRCHLTRARANLRKAVHASEATSPLRGARPIRVAGPLRLVAVQSVK